MKTLVKIFVLVGFTVCLTAFVKFETALVNIKLVSGDVKVLKGDKKLFVKYDYTNMKVGGKKEDEYLKEKVAEKNNKKKGSGDDFQEKWYSDRTDKFAPKFEELLNKYLTDAGVTASSADSTDTKHTIILKTTYTEPGFNVGVAKKPAYINADIIIVETLDQSKIGAKLTMSNVPGQDAMGNDYDTGTRLQESYAKCGKTLGKYLCDNAFETKQTKPSK